MQIGLGDGFKPLAAVSVLPLFLAGVAGVAVLEVCTWWAWTIGAISLSLAISLHLVLSILLIGCRHRCKKQGENAPLLDLACLFSITLGPIGAVGVLCLALLLSFYRRSAVPFDVWYKGVVPQYLSEDEGRLVDQLTIMGSEAEYNYQAPIPFADILSSGEQANKRMILSLMLRNFHPSFGGIFLDAIADPDSAIRVQAASAITRIEENFQLETNRLSNAYRRKPSDFGVIVKLANHYDGQASSGLSDKATLEGYRAQAQQLYIRACEERPSDTEIPWLLGRSLLRSGKLSNAAKVFEDVLEQLSANKTSATLLQQVWYWECLYEQARYKELQDNIVRSVAQIPDDSILPLAVKGSIEIWLANAPVGLTET
ncbi:MAG: hypothetical protein KUG76_07250 [Gammaproteobacteria bacterium]|nr:hypothetical protein [Gammaproteobacteria bacterium]